METTPFLAKDEERINESHDIDDWNKRGQCENEISQNNKFAETRNIVTQVYNSCFDNDFPNRLAFFEEQITIQ